jgi:flagellar biosynthesis/type III secretory pathway chaperone
MNSSNNNFDIDLFITATNKLLSSLKKENSLLEREYKYSDVKEINDTNKNLLLYFQWQMNNFAQYLEAQIGNSTEKESIQSLHSLIKEVQLANRKNIILLRKRGYFSQTLVNFIKNQLDSQKKTYSNKIETKKEKCAQTSFIERKA